MFTYLIDDMAGVLQVLYVLTDYNANDILHTWNMGHEKTFYILINIKLIEIDTNYYRTQQTTFSTCIK